MIEILKSEILSDTVTGVYTPEEDSANAYIPCLLQHPRFIIVQRSDIDEVVTPDHPAEEQYIFGGFFCLLDAKRHTSGDPAEHLGVVQYSVNVGEKGFSSASLAGYGVENGKIRVYTGSSLRKFKAGIAYKYWIGV